MNDQNDHDFTGGDLKAAVTGWTPNRRRFLSVAGLAVGGAVVGTTAAGCGTAQTGNTTRGEGEAQGPRRRRRRDPLHRRVPVGTAHQLQPVRRQPRVAHGRRSEPADLRVAAPVQPAGRVAGRWSRQGDPGARSRARSCCPLQDGTKWSDGSELTAEDVAFTFDLAKQTALSFSTIWNYVDSIEATDARTVTIKIKDDPYNPGFVKNVLATTLIVPKAVWSKIAPDKITADTEPGADRFRPVQARQGRPDPDQPDPGRRLLGQGRLRHPGDDRDQPPDLQEQQRR